jgi:HSP20 family molecular chaperone IbpA
VNDIEKTVPETRDPAVPAQEVTREPDRFALPPVDIYEEEDRLVVLADLPGVRKEGLSVQVEQGILTIEGRITHEMPGSLVQREFALIPFFRQFRITEAIDPNRIRASLRQGVLRLDLMKAEKAKPRQIPVES